MLNVEFVAGRNYDKARIGDKYAVILNEEAVKALELGIRKVHGAKVHQLIFLFSSEFTTSYSSPYWLLRPLPMGWEEYG